MKTAEGYRFSLQFKAETDAHIQVGELLERLKNKKSEFVVSAILEYMQKHPELSDPAATTHVIRVAIAGYSKDTIREMLRELVDERLAGIAVSERSKMSSNGAEHAGTESDDDVIGALLDNLDKFS